MVGLREGHVWEEKEKEEKRWEEMIISSMFILIKF